MINKKNTIYKEYINNKYKKKLNSKFTKILSKIKNEIDFNKNTFHVLSHKFNNSFRVNDLTRFKKYKDIVIIGMGGSILGTEAIYECFKFKIKKNIFFLNDLNVRKILNLKKKIIFKKTLFLIVSKSGNTIETLTNFISLKILTKNSKNIILITEKKNNILYSLAQKYNLMHIEHKNYIGGRYSVLSDVGLIPSILFGLNIKKLRSNIKKPLINKDSKFLRESTIKLSNLLLQNKITNLVFLNYCPVLEKFLYWCQQLIAESLGKKGKGFFPVVSNVPKDHHSLLQLYLDGPKDKFFYIFSLEEKSKIRLKGKSLPNKISYLKNKSFDAIKSAQIEAVKKTLKKNKIPFREFNIKKLNEQIIGELFSYFILETAIIGQLVGINPFNQPAVEQVKTFTKNILK